MPTLPSRNNTLDIGTKNYRETDIKITAYITQLSALSLKIFAKIRVSKVPKNANYWKTISAISSGYLLLVAMKPAYYFKTIFSFG